MIKSCLTCVNNAAKLLPFLSEKDQWEILIEDTAFPMGNCNHNYKQLRKVRRKMRKTGYSKRVKPNELYNQVHRFSITKPTNEN